MRYVMRRMDRFTLSWIWGCWPNPKDGTSKERVFSMHGHDGNRLGDVEYFEFRDGYGRASSPWGEIEIGAVSAYGYEIRLNGRKISEARSGPPFTKMTVSLCEPLESLEFHGKLLESRLSAETSNGIIDIVSRIVRTTSSGDTAVMGVKMAWSEYRQLPREVRPNSREGDTGLEWIFELPTEMERRTTILPSLVAVMSFERLRGEVPLHK